MIYLAMSIVLAIFWYGVGALHSHGMGIVLAVMAFIFSMLAFGMARAAGSEDIGD